MATKQEVLDQALALDPLDRIDVANELLESVDGEELELLSDEELAAEVERRRQELRDGTVQPIPWEEARERLRQEFPDLTDA